MWSRWDEAKIQALKGVGQFMYARDSTEDTFFKAAAGAERCKWNRQHNEPERSADDLVIPDKISQDNCVAAGTSEATGNNPAASIRRRPFKPFEKRLELDAKRHEIVHKRSKIATSLGKLAKVVALRDNKGSNQHRHRRRLMSTIGKGAGSMTAGVAELPMAEEYTAAIADGIDGQGACKWFTANSFESKSGYGTVSNGKRNLGNINSESGAEVIDTEMDQQVVAGAPPFGWDRESCTLCWTLPYWVSNLVRKCGANENGTPRPVVYAQSDADWRTWNELRRPIVFACEAGYDHLDKHTQRNAFETARLFDGMPWNRNDGDTRKYGERDECKQRAGEECDGDFST